MLVDMMDDILVFKAMGEETKFLILKTLLEGEICACKIPSRIKRTQSNTSMHLAKLAEWKLIKHHRDGKKILYSIKDKRIFDLFKVIKVKP
jgi:ArsR family transcriptional regulator, lead/cadmium/zinc/bismuth-responsive transcriptional repressor